jgi:hypothetical protein
MLVISIIGDSIQRSIVNDCNEAGGWISLSADEVRDTANKEQLAITIRYVDKEKNIKENFQELHNLIRCAHHVSDRRDVACLYNASI